MRMPWSKYSCSGISLSVDTAFSNGVWAVWARQVSRFLSSWAQSAIMVRENSPLMMSSMCFAKSGVRISLISSER